MGMSQFELDSHPGDAVMIAPVSTKITLLTGNFAGNFAFLGLWERCVGQETPVPQAILDEFPTRINRENISKNWEFLGNIRDFDTSRI